MDERTSRIAVLDDEPKILKLLKLMLEENFACTVEVFTDPIIALERIRQVPFQAISLDHRMPKLTGMDLVKLIRTSKGPNQKTRILLLTGHLDDAECAHLDLLDQVVFLEKPIDEARYLRWMKFMLVHDRAAAEASQDEPPP